jgi:hypothetical protein
MDQPSHVDHQGIKRHEGSSSTIFFAYHVDGMLLLQWISTDISNHIVGLAKIAADRKIISLSYKGATAVFAFNGVRIHQVLLIKKAKL